MKKNSKTAVVLLNLGGPDSLEAVRPFLFNLFYDRAIIRLPNPFRWLLAHLISLVRKKTAQKVYSLMGGSSPILKETEAQKIALQKKLGDEYQVFICMRHWHPMTPEVLSKIKEYNPDEIILLPLYPQFSTTTTGSSVAEFKKAMNDSALDVPCKVICCYPTSPGFIDAHAQLINEALDKNTDNISNTTVLFSAHGLPEKIIEEGDPYQFQIEKTVEAIVKKLNKKIEYKITYQSRVGPMKWLDPNTEDEIKTASKLQKTIIVIPIAFVSEHVETLVELDIEYAEIAKDLGAAYIRIAALAVADAFIEDLASNVRKMSLEDVSCRAYPDKVLCPEEFSGCLCK